ncbi:short-chain dehydrogenase [Pararhodobacter aggregans]|uniref:Short-chain dehydrogenase n=2 Tax=Pararhodobacter aggregans TaxID=404875 RepID=A0A2T7UX19_9RHOB|nr:NADP-dependent 3-hydroxy acid dehydrogenase YdfG [Pararhodobacter aggregans]PVE49109.1 short-chain dehydrogenase [Pararhodobacter aggregans]
MTPMSEMSVLITGGGSGIGEGTARHFARHGARVTICGRREEKLKAVADSIGPACAYVVADITRDADCARIIEAAVAHGGGLDALINNAGNMLRGPIAEMTREALTEVFDSNVVSGMILTGLALPHLSARKGSVVFLGSVHTRRAYPGASPYAATKGAVEVLAKVLAAELGPQGVRVNCVIPGAVSTELNIRAGLVTEDQQRVRMKALESSHALGRIGTEEELAEGIAYMACAEWVTGTSLVVDGGLSLGISNL